MTDRELLELAAKAAGMYAGYIEWCDCDSGDMYSTMSVALGDDTGRCRNWNPLIDDGDALRLAVKLAVNTAMRLVWQGGAIGYGKVASPFTQLESGVPDPYAATRRAIVRAAAEIGKAMP